MLLAWFHVTCGAAIYGFAAGLVPEGTRQAATFAPATLDLNAAAMQELAVLPGIGPVRAEAIVLHRLRHGPFARVEDLLGVDGIGPETLEALLPYVRTTVADAAPAMPSARRR